jgi:dolichyl-diphosphooligosaccharide--protein glycosyltransferase
MPTRSGGTFLLWSPDARAVVWAFLLVALAIASRSIPFWDSVVENGRVVVRDPDACYHMRRAELIADSPFTLGAFDTYLSHPHGSNVIWPPLYDSVLAVLLGVTPGDNGPPGPSIAIGLLPPVLFGAVVAFLFFIGRTLYPGRLALALVAAGLPVALPVDLLSTRIGQLDHHAAELLCVVAMVAALLRSLVHLESGAPARRASLASGITLAAGLLVQLTLIALIPLVILATLLARKIDGMKRAEFLTWVFGTSLAVVAIPALVYHFSGAPFRHHQFGSFHLASLAVPFLLAASVHCWGLSSRRKLQAKWEAVRRTTAVACCAATIALLVALFEQGMGGLAFLVGGGSGWVATIAESQSPLQLSGPRLWNEVVGRISLLVLLLPLSLTVWARRSVRGDVSSSVLLATVLLVSLLALLQLRFLPHLGMFLGLVVAVLLSMSDGASSPRWRRLVPWAAIPLLLVAVVQTATAWRVSEPAWDDFDRMRPILDHLSRAAQAGYAPLAEGEESRRADAAAQLPQGVLSEWSFGHFVQYHGAWPVVVDNFGEHAGDISIPRRILLGTERDNAFAELSDLRVRYVLVGDLVGTFAGLLATEDQQRRFVKSSETLAGSSLRVVFDRDIGETLLYRLVRQRGSGFFDASANRFVPALNRMRLVACSAEEVEIGGQLVPLFKLFEVVPGARLQVHGRQPGEEGILEATVVGPYGQTFPLIDRAIVDSSGRLELIVPYPTDPSPGMTGLQRCEVVFHDARYPVERISEEAVRDGRIVELAISSTGRDG